MAAEDSRCAHPIRAEESCGWKRFQITPNVPGQPDYHRFSIRAEVPQMYLGRGREQLQKLLRGEMVEPTELKPSASTVELEPFRRWLHIGYAALLKAAHLHRTPLPPSQKMQAYCEWIDTELQLLPSREAYLGLLLLGGTPAARSMVRSLMKLDRTEGDVAKAVWGATWDVAYTRLQQLASYPPLSLSLNPPVVFVTDDDALAALIPHIQPKAALYTRTSANPAMPFTAEEMNSDLLSQTTASKDHRVQGAHLDSRSRQADHHVERRRDR